MNDLEPQMAGRRTLLVIDDQPANLDVMAGILGPDYEVRVATSGEKGLALAAADPLPDLILLDIMMPGLDGYEVCRRLKAHESTQRIPLIFVTAMGEVDDETYGLSLGAVDYIVKPVNPALLRARVRAHLQLYDQRRHLAELVLHRTRELEDTRLQIIRRLGRAAEYTEDESGQHVIRVSHYARLLAMAVGMPEYRADMLFNAAPMHDVGKLGIPDAILRKPGPLDADEWALVRRHPAIGASIIGEHGNEMLEMARVIALTHHEKWDGSGYPRGLSGDDIPLVGRIVAIADVFDTMTTGRTYKPPQPVAEAVAYLQQESGTHFDPELVTRFIALLPQVEAIRSQYADTPPDTAAA